ncbi:MAG: integration host factor subunit beta [Caulobacteraceae bacterium]|nr:integration host factor subunit beta [Caulobacter sp.]
MTKSELIARLAAENPQLRRADMERAVGVVLETLSQALEDGRRVELRGFGAFSLHDRPARDGRNPRTGEPVAVEAKAAVLFKAGKEMRERLNVESEGD